MRFRGLRRPDVPKRRRAVAFFRGGPVSRPCGRRFAAFSEAGGLRSVPGAPLALGPREIDRGPRRRRPPSPESDLCVSPDWSPRQCWSRASRAPRRLRSRAAAFRRAAVIAEAGSAAGEAAGRRAPEGRPRPPRPDLRDRPRRRCRPAGGSRAAARRLPRRPPVSAGRVRRRRLRLPPAGPRGDARRRLRSAREPRPCPRRPADRTSAAGAPTTVAVSVGRRRRRLRPCDPRPSAVETTRAVAAGARRRSRRRRFPCPRRLPPHRERASTRPSATVRRPRRAEGPCGLRVRRATTSIGVGTTAAVA